MCLGYAEMAVIKLDLDINEVRVCSFAYEGKMPFFPQLGFINFNDD